MKHRLAPIALLVALAGCGSGTRTSDIPSGNGTATTASSSTTGATTATSAAPTGCKTVKEPPPKPNGSLKKPKLTLAAARAWTATVTTNCGTFAFRLDVKQSPHATASLAYLARRKFFDRTWFHRIVPGFVIQGGDPTGTGAGGPGYSTVDKPPAKARYVRGVVAMAKTSAEAPGTAGSQFFVVTGKDAGLPPDYAIVGKITRGMDVVTRIGKLGDQSQAPTTTILISSFRVTSSQDA